MGGRTTRHATSSEPGPGHAPAGSAVGRGRDWVGLLGGFTVISNGRRAALPSAVQRVLALLALQGRTLSRAHAAGLLWPDKPDSRALANLRSALWRAEDELDGLLVCDDRTLALADRVVIDVDEFERRCLGAVDPAAAIDDLAAFAHTAMTDLLPGWYDDWITFERERLRQVHLYGLEAMTAALRRSGRSAEAVIVGLAAVARDPLRESAHRLVIEAHLDLGNVAEARRQYGLCRGYLREHLGVEPSPSLGELLTPPAGGRSAPRVRRFGAVT